VAAAKVSGEARQLPFQVRGSLQTVLALRLITPDDPNFFPLLVDKIAHSPDFFRDAPLVLDVGRLASGPPIDLAAFVERLHQQRLMPVGIQNGSPAWNEAAIAAGLAVFGAGSQPREPTERPPAAPARQAAVGHIHVYGALRGRAFAGIEGDESAMIFCDQLEAQLVSVAGVHKVNEEIDPKQLRKRARIVLEHERIIIHTAP
jgi:septum site-determining protein MinC